MTKSIIDAWKPKNKKTPAVESVIDSIYLMTTTIAGLFYTDNIDDLLDDLHIGDDLLFEREPNNQHDENAIIVNNPNGEKLGYIPRETNTVFARLMDAGKKIFGIVKTLNDDDNYYDRVMVDVFMED